MDKHQAQEIIKETFESPFEKQRFTKFILEFLNHFEEDTFIHRGYNIPDSYDEFISSWQRLGKYSDGENRIDILIVNLKKGTFLERARSKQRNFVAGYLQGKYGRSSEKEAALVAYVSPSKEDWRFSLVKMDYKFEQSKSGRMKVKEEFTPARRWSFLVGKNEKSHTAQTRLVDILKNDEQDPTLKEIEKAFDIETVTKEFFLEYRGLFLHTKDELDKVVKKDPKIKADFEAKGVDTVNFAKKLLGQIVFLYFLQKKGWFGVGRDNDWGTGSKHFLRELFDEKHSDYGNFFNDILEPLFYDALSRDRSDIDHWNDQFKCKIPFLNGGLFDPIGNYNWVRTDIIIPDKLFSNKIINKEGDEGTGILGVFDRYNFTVKEDEPLEKEVAIDPELLGKAYEKFNAIRPDNYAEFRKALESGKTGEENKFNKKFGVYYTPREIVHYMCQQSLINYLATVLSNCHSSESGNPEVSKEDIEALIHTGEQVSENEVAALIKEQNIIEGKQKTSGYKLQLPESIKNNAVLIDNKLAEVTVCDPAVGSGAFPVGMMSEIVKARNVLSLFITHASLSACGDAQAGSLRNHRQDACDTQRTTYDFKRRCIEHSLYGVDIDPGAVEIAKLRLWLSLVVDEDDIKNIKPLPNLDYRIMQGNSLISEFMGIDFDSDKEENSGKLTFKDETDKLIEHFQQKKDEFLNESNVSRKTKLKEEVDNLLVKIFEAKLKNQKADYFNKIKYIENKHSNWPTEKQRNESIKRDKEKLYKESGFNLESAEKQLKEFTSGNKIKPFFLWNLYFSEVFHKKGGFNVVIANPPYGRYTGTGITDTIKNKLKKHCIYGPTSDLAEFFIRNTLNSLLSKNGFLTFIVPKGLSYVTSWREMRKILLTEHNLYVLIDAGKSFEAVLYEMLIFILQKGNKSNPKKNITTGYLSQGTII